MGKNSKIGWTDHTFNPWWGCQKVSPGCQNCYAERMANRFKWTEPGFCGPGLWGPGSERRVFGEQHWREPLKWNAKIWLACSACTWRGPIKYCSLNKFGEPRCPACHCGNPMLPTHQRVFCGSMCDVFEDHPGLEDERIKLWSLIEKTPELIWMLLTKRPENIEKMLPEIWSYFEYFRIKNKAPEGNPMPPNVWMGITAENQAELESRWPVLEGVGRYFYMSKLFVSVEPLLGPLYLEDKLQEVWESEEDNVIWIRDIDWVIVGGETGNNARPMNPSWVRSIQRQCKEAGAPFFFKGWEEWGPLGSVKMEALGEVVLPPVVMFEDGSEVYKWGRENLDNKLDGEVWEGYPVER